MNISRSPLSGRQRAIAAGLALGVIASAVGCSAEGGETANGGLTVSYMDSGTYNAAAESIQAGFDASNDTSVAIEAFPFATLGQNNATDLVTGTGEFDVLSVSAWDVEIFDRLEPLDKRLANWSGLDEMLPGLLEDGPTPFSQGSPVGVTYAADAYGVFVNTSYFPADTEFTDWNDLVSKAEALKASLPADVAPISFAFGAVEQIPSLFQGAYDGYYLTKDGKWGLDPEKAAAALTTTKSIASLGPQNAASLSIDEANELFLSGKAAMLIGWPSFVRDPLNDPERSQIGDDWAQVPFPGPGAPNLSNWALSLSGLSENQELGWKWIDAYITPANAKKWMFEYGIGSPFASTYTDPELLAQYANDLPIQALNLDRAKPLPLTLKAFEAFYRPMGDFIANNGDAAATVADIVSALSSMEVPAALVSSAKANGLVAE